MAITTAWREPIAQAEAACMFCGTPLANEGGPFLDHVDQTPGCRAAYRAWLENLNGDWHGGD